MKLTKAEVRQVYAACEEILKDNMVTFEMLLMHKFLVYEEEFLAPSFYFHDTNEQVLSLCLFVAVYSEGRDD